MTIFYTINGKFRWEAGSHTEESLARRIAEIEAAGGIIEEVTR